MIKNRYKIISKIGNGKFGIVYKGINTNTNEMIAIKTESKNTLRFSFYFLCYKYIKYIK